MEVCRLCAKEGAKYYFRDISMYIEEIHKVLPIVVCPDDGFPQKLCFKCENKLMEFFTFYEETSKTAFSLRAPCHLSNKSKINEISDTKEFLKVNEDFITVSLDNDTKLFSCSKCKATYLSERTAALHQCTQNSDIKAVSVSGNINTHGENVSLEQSENKRIKTKRKWHSIQKANGPQTSTETVHTASKDRSLIESSLSTEKSHMYNCNFCTLTFTRKTNLVSHEQDHLKRISSNY